MKRNITLVFVAILFGCGGVERLHLMPRHVASGPPPRPRQVLRGERTQLLIGGWHTGNLLALSAYPATSSGAVPTTVEVVSGCEWDGRRPARRELAHGAFRGFAWDLNCPALVQPRPAHESIVVRFLDSCTDGQCEALEATLDLEPGSESWPPWESP